MITVTEHNKAEWARMAQTAYSQKRNDIGHKYSGAASMRSGTELSTAVYDKLQEGYRKWLVFNEWPDLA